MTAKPVNPEWKIAFDRDGFVCIRSWLSETEISELCDNVERYVETVVPDLPREHVFLENRDDAATLKQLQQMDVHDDYFGQLMNVGRFRELAVHLLDGPVKPINLQYFNKPPRVGQATPPHQDGFYFMLNPCEAVTMWLALDLVDEQNGCVRYVPGSHKDGMRCHGRTNTLGFSQGITDYAESDSEQELPMAAQPGDLLVHHAMTIHRADGNESPTRSRRALGLIYYSERANVDEEAHAGYQRRLREEMISEEKI